MLREIERFLDRGVPAADHGDALLRKKKPSHVAHAETPRPRNLSSEGRPRYFAVAPVAMISASQV